MLSRFVRSLTRGPATAGALFGAALLTTVPAMGQESTNPVVAKVNGDPIYLSDIEGQYQSLPQEYRQVPMQMLFGQLSTLAIDNKLLSDQALASGIEDDELVQLALLAARDRVLREAYLHKIVNEGIDEAELRARYDTMMQDQAFSSEEVHARHILVEQETEAKAIIEQLDGGADFVELAKEKSTGPSAPNGGDLGYFTKDRMVPPFAEAAFIIEPGSYGAEPIETQFGWHVIKVEDKRVNTPTFEESEAQIREEIGREIVTVELEALRTSASIEQFDLEGNILPEGGAEETPTK